MPIERKLAESYFPKGEPGFLGAGHIARPVIQRPFQQSDPFILLMDDMLDKKDTNPVGGPHPHAGFETVTLMIDGELGVGEHRLKTGDLQMMTAGSGIVHTETIDTAIKIRLFQLWLALPKKDRWATPRVQDLPLENVPQSDKDGVAVKLYSGSFAGLSSQLKNYAQVIIADITVEPGVVVTEKLPANYNTFIYVLKGEVRIGAEGKQLSKDEVGWLDLPGTDDSSNLTLRAGEEGVRLVLYAGLPTGNEIVSHGPFIGDSSEDIRRLYQEYRIGKMKHVSSLPDEQQIRY